MIEPNPISTSADIVANAGTYYRNTHYIVVALALGAGIWFAYDGFVTYPAERKAFEDAPESQRAHMVKPHTELDIRIQHRLAYTLIPLSVVMLTWFLYRSRGEYRLSGMTLYVPGHPAVPLECILGLDKSKWDRKGIAYVDYDVPGMKAGRLALDDFVYRRAPTDQIVERIETHLTSPTAAPAAESRTNE